MTPISITLRKINKLKEELAKEIVTFVLDQMQKLDFGGNNKLVTLPNDVYESLVADIYIQEKLIDVLAHERMTFVFMGASSILIRQHLIAAMYQGKLYSLTKEAGIEEIKNKFKGALKPSVIKLNQKEIAKIKLAEERFGTVNITDEFRRHHLNMLHVTTDSYAISRFGVKTVAI